MATKRKRIALDQRHPSYDAPAVRLTRVRRQELEDLLAGEPLDFMDQDLFREPDAVRAIFIDAPELPSPNCDWYHPGLDPELESRQPAGANTLLTAAQERAIFTQFNYARFRASQLHGRHTLLDAALQIEVGINIVRRPEVDAEYFLVGRT